jgi:group I intron endonuclease
MGFIYRITNLISGKKYIGETLEKDPEKRWKGHQNAFKRGVGCPALRDAVKVYGIENFRFEVIIICFDEDRFVLEREYIKKHNTIAPNGYNILEGGVGGAGFKGKKHSESVRKRISEASKKWQSDPEVRKTKSVRTKDYYKKQKEAGVDFGKKVRESEKFRKAMEERRVGGRGRIITEDTKKKTSESLKEFFAKNGPHMPNIENHRKAMASAKGVKVEKYDLENNLLGTFNSIADAARACGISKGAIGFCLRGKHKTAGGFKWKRYDETKIEHI